MTYVLMVLAMNLGNPVPDAVMPIGDDYGLVTFDNVQDCDEAVRTAASDPTRYEIPRPGKWAGGEYRLICVPREEIQENGPCNLFGKDMPECIGRLVK